MPRNPSPKALASRLRQLIASPPGSRIELDQTEYRRPSIHVALSVLRREYRDLMGPGLAPSVSLEEDPSGQVWVLQYCGLTERGRLPKPQLSAEESVEAKRKTWRDKKRRRASRLHARLVERTNADLRLRQDASLGFGAVDPAWVEQEAQEQEKQKQKSREARTPAQKKAFAALLAKRAAKIADRAAYRIKRQAELERARLPSQTKIQEELTRIANAITYHEERLDLVEARLVEAREAKQNAKRPHELSSERQAAIARGEVSCRYDRAQIRIDKCLARIEHYESHVDRLEQERQKWKDIRAHVEKVWTDYEASKPKDINRSQS